LLFPWVLKMTSQTQFKGKYAKANINQQLLIHDPPTTSAQDIICTRTNDTSTDLLYPSTRYISVKNLGDGSASLIFEGYDNQEKKKIIIKKISKKDQWRKELDVLQKLSKSESGRLLKYIDYYESQRCSYIVTEFYEGFDLFEHIDLNVPYPTKKALILCLEMARCIKECHDNNILHLDIKCENYMVKSDKLFEEGKPNIVLIDFGHSEIVPKGEQIEKLRKGYSYGTSYYTCPEGYFERIHSSKSDIWSLGVCLSLLLTGDYPYIGKKDDYYRNSVMDNISLTNNDLDPVLFKLLTDSLNSIPFKRPTIDEFISRIIKILQI
jgi:serine/threonine protein kinase